MDHKILDILEDLVEVIDVHLASYKSELECGLCRILNDIRTLKETEG